jgi:hypothetical protein
VIAVLLSLYRLQRILAVQYAVPDSLGLSPGCSALLRRIFVRDPSCRISLADIQRDPWHLTNLPLECQASGSRGAWGCVAGQAASGEQHPAAVRVCAHRARGEKGGGRASRALPMALERV